MQSLKEKYRFFITFTCASAFFKSLMAPFWVLYFNKIGLSYEQIAFLVIVNHLSTLVFEIPTGAVADSYGRKLSVGISLIIGAIVPLGIYFSESYLLLLLLHVLAGLGATFMSGAFDAWFADSLLASDANLDLTKYWGNLISANYCGSTIGFLMGSALVHLHFFREIWLIEGVGILFIFFYTFLKGQEDRDNKNSEKKNYAILLKKVTKGSTFLFRHKYLMSIVLGSCCFFFSSGIISLLWQPYFNKLGIPMAWFGPILTITMIISIFAPRYVNVMVRYFKRVRTALAINSFACFVSLFAMVFVNRYAFGPYIIYTALYSLHTPILMSYINKLIPSDERATIISTYNLLISATTIFCTYLFGYLSTYFSLVATLLISVCAVLFSALIFSFSNGRKSNEASENK
ncbi:MAG: MFS transporter [Bacteroidales bacterium]